MIKPGTEEWCQAVLLVIQCRQDGMDSALHSKSNGDREMRLNRAGGRVILSLLLVVLTTGVTLAQKSDIPSASKLRYSSPTTNNANIAGISSKSLGRWDDKEAYQIVLPILKRPSNLKRIVKKLEVNCSVSPCSPIIHKVKGAYFLKYSNKNSMMLVVSSNIKNRECHACGVVLSLFEFERTKSGWSLQNAETAAIAAGSWGQLTDELSLYVVGTDQYGVVLESNYLAQGVIEGATSIYTHVGDEFKMVFGETTSVNDEGSLQPHANGWKSKFTFRQAQTGYYDLAWKLKGLKDGKRIDKQKIYKFNGKEYAATDTFE